MATRLKQTTTRPGGPTTPGTLVPRTRGGAPETIDMTTTTSALQLTRAVDLVLARWTTRGAWSDLSVDKTGRPVGRWARRMGAMGIHHLAAVTPASVSGFIDAPSRDGVPPELTTRHARRAALRCFFATCRELDLGDHDPTRDIRLPRRPNVAARPLTDEEVALARTTAGALGGLRAVAWAIGESGAGSREIPQVRLTDLDSTMAPTTLRLPGTRWIRRRTVPLTPWGQRVLARRAAVLLDAGAGPDRLLAYDGTAAAGGQQRQASVCNSIRTVLQRSGPAYATAFGLDGREALVLLLMDLQHYGYLIAQIFFGLWLFPLGILAWRSGMFSRIISVLLVTASTSCLLDVLLQFTAPGAADVINPVLVTLFSVAEGSMLFFLLIKGVLTPKPVPREPVSV